MNKYRRSNEELLIRIENGDKKAKEEIIENNVGLVRSVIKRFSGRGHEAEDLFQIGCIGLIKAVDKFDRSFDVAFSTYAVPMIIGEIKRFIRDDGIIKVSRAYKDISAKAAAVRERLMSESGNEPTLSQIADELGITPQELSTALEAVMRPESLYAKTDDGKSESREMVDKIECDIDYEEKIENRIMLSEAFDGIDEREKLIIYMRYFKQRTQSEIAAMLGISQVQVSRLEKKVLLKMREKLTS
ncbi:MAG: SigB/SigF/SigG family RNA polymerase sigma factor [Clostridiales bacterium]|nr:SigB/SigF/SigG family RNA polymerase sigma factor [Clostridiales bacterium]